MKNSTLYALLCAVLCTVFAFAAPARADEAPDAAAAIAAARDSIVTLQLAAEEGTITKAQAAAASEKYVQRASDAAGHPMTVTDILAAPNAAGVAAASAQELTSLQRFAGLVTFTNILWVLGIVIGVACVAILFGKYVAMAMALFAAIPFVVYEVLFYLASVALMAWGYTLSPETGPYVGLTGALALAAALGFTASSRKVLQNGVAFSGILFAVWTVAALAYGSAILGFIAVAALLTALGFSVIVSPLCYCIGFRDDSSVGKATSAAFVMLAVFVFIRAFKAYVPFLAPFENGALFLGSFVGYLGLLISSSRWFPSKGNYVLFQAVTVSAGLLALFLGSWLGIGELQKIGGTFFVLYLVEKIAEIPAKSVVAWAWIGLMVAGAIYGSSFYVKAHMDDLRPYILAL